MKQITNIKSRKIGLIGCGAVGMSFIYSAINTGLANDYILIDVNNDVAEGNAFDIEDGNAVLPNTFNSIKAGTYSDLKDVDVLVITAARPQKPGETRLQMVADNAKIMKDIATQVKASGFSGITLIAANPVDTLTYVYWKITGYPKETVIGSGTVLDTSRFRLFLSKHFDVSTNSIRAWVIGEHGDSAITLYSNAWVGGRYIYELIGNPKEVEKFKEVHDQTVNRAYEIINRKRVTNYGIGASLNRICTAIIKNEKAVLPVGIICSGEYGIKDAVLGLPAKLTSHGVEKVELPYLQKDELAGLIASSEVIKNNIKEALETLNIKL